MRPFVVVIAASAASAAQAQALDPLTAALTQEWQASETAHAHLAEAIRNLAQAYDAQKKHQDAVDAYWKDYVAGLTKDTQTGSN